MTNIEDLRARVKVLLGLLEDAHPGLSTWHEGYERAAANVLSFWGYGVANVSLLRAATKEQSAGSAPIESFVDNMPVVTVTNGAPPGCTADAIARTGWPQEPAGSGMDGIDPSHDWRNIIGLLKSTIGLCSDEEPHQAISANLWHAVNMIYVLYGGSPRKVGEDGALATYLLNTSPPDWEYDKVISMAAESLSLSSPIEPPPTITPQMMSGVFVRSVNNTDPEHDHVYDHRIAAAEVNKLLGAQASSEVREAADRAYCDYIDQMRKPECLGYEQKLKEGRFGKAELDAHVRAGELLGRHRALAEVSGAALAPSRQGAAKRVEG